MEIIFKILSVLIPGAYFLKNRDWAGFIVTFVAVTIPVLTYYIIISSFEYGIFLPSEFHSLPILSLFVYLSYVFVAIKWRKS